MKRAISLLVVLCFVSACAWADDKDKKDDTKKDAGDAKALEILKQVDENCKKVRAVKYDVTFEQRRPEQEPDFKLKGSVMAAGEFVDFTPEKFLIDVEVIAAGSTEPRRVTGGSDGATFFLVDHRDKKAYEDIDPAVMGSSGPLLRAAAMIEFLHRTPFSDEINGKSRELKGSKVVKGVGCYEVYVVYAAESAPPATWHFSKNDFLPRRRIDYFTGPDGQKFTRTKVISNLVVDPKLDEMAFKLKLPDGYTKTDDFAP